MAQLKELPKSVKTLIGKVESTMSQRPTIVDMFKNCMKNTWQTTIRTMPDHTTFVITGDIPAMWLRDSAAQLRPFLLYSFEDDTVADMIQGLVERQFQFILHDPYANAFNEAPNANGHQTDETMMTPWIWERKYEIDSLCYPIQLSYLLWKNSGRTDQFNLTFQKGVRTIIDLWKTEQYHERDSNYRFQRHDGADTDTLTRQGKGAETGYTGMTWSGFRPSDDACTYGYLIPSNMFAVVSLRYVAEIAEKVLNDTTLAEEAKNLGSEIAQGIQKFGTVIHPQYGEIYAYETDGLGNHLLMDDANVPSLLSIPYLGYSSADDPIYQNTRRFILSKDNPYYFQGKAAEGIGSPHTPDNYIWHISLAMQALTAEDQGEKERLLAILEKTDGGKGMMHESFCVDDPTKYTREWFSWANMMFCELVLDVCNIQVKI